MSKARRAKKSKMSSKILAVMMLGVVSLGIFEISTREKTNISTILGSALETYEASNFVKDSFTEGSISYLPILYKNTEERITKADIDKDFSNFGLKTKSYGSNTLGTGTNIIATNGKQDYPYQLLIYGDVNGDGTVNVLDALSIVDHLLWGNTYTLTGINKKAANIESVEKDNIDILDALKIVEFIVNGQPLLGGLPESDISKDKIKPEIFLNGDAEVILNIGDKYEEKGAYATDNFDPVINSRIITQGNVDTSKPGINYITYSVTDISGNGPATVARRVVVTDSIESITIDTLPKTEYVDGEEITLNGMVAHANWKYDKQKHDLVNIDNIEFSPKIASMDKTEVKFTYKYTIDVDSQKIEKTVEGSFPIKVTERRPIITFTGHNNVPNVVLKVGGTYVEGATAYDELADETLGVTWVTTDENGNEVDDVDTSKPGKYTIKYTSEPSSVSDKKGEATRTVEIVDYIKSVAFTTDENFKSTYVDGDVASLDGIKTIATYAYDTEVLGNPAKDVTLPLEVLLTGTINYDRNNASNNANRELPVKCVTTRPNDEGTGEEAKTFTSTGIKFNVVKKVETIHTTSGAGIPSGGTASNPVKGDILSEVWVGRLKSGVNETNISTNNIKTPVVLRNGVPVNEEQNGFKTYAEARPVYKVSGDGKELDGYVDIYFVGISEGTYTIEVTPKEQSSYTSGKILYVETKPNTEVNHIKYKFTKNAQGTGEEINSFKAGETIYAKLSYFHRYEADGKHLDVALSAASNLAEPEIWERRFLSDGITETNPVKVTSGITARYLSNDSSVIEIISEENAVIEPKSIKLSISTEGTLLDPSKLISDSEPIRITPKEEQVLYLGSKGNTLISENLALSLRNVSEEDRDKYDLNYEVIQDGDYYYTAIPVYAYSNYDINNNYVGNGGYGKEIELIPDDISNNYADKNSSSKRIVIYDGINQTGTLSYIDLIGINTNNEVIRTDTVNKKVAKIGIAVNSNAVPNINEDEALEGRNLTVYFDGTQIKQYTVSIIKQAISSIHYTAASPANPGTTCFKELTVAIISSGDRQEDFISANEANCVVNRVRQNSAGTATYTKILDTKETSSAGGVTVKKAIKDGEITFNLIAEKSEDYVVIPYIEIGGKKITPVLSTANGEKEDVVQVSIRENTLVDEAYFIKGEDKSGIVDKAEYEDIKDKLEPIKQYGTANIALTTMKEIVFVHDYSKEFPDYGKTLPKRVIIDVPQSNVTITEGSGVTSDMNIQKMIVNSSGGFKKPEDDDPSSLKGIGIIIPPDTPGETSQAGKRIEFSLRIKNNDNPSDDCIINNIIATIGAEVKVEVDKDNTNSNLYIYSADSVGDTTNKNYVTGKNGEIVVPLTVTTPGRPPKTETYYYTLLKIEVNSGDKNVEINQNNISVAFDVDNQAPGKVIFVDNVNEEGYTYIDSSGNPVSVDKGKAIIAIKGFKKIDTAEVITYEPCEEDDDVIEYVGIAIKSSDMDFLDPDSGTGGQAILKTVKIYYGGKVQRQYNLVAAPVVTTAAQNSTPVTQSSTPASSTVTSKPASSTAGNGDSKKESEEE